MVVLLKKETLFRGIFKGWEAVLTYAQKPFHISMFENAGFGWACRVYEVLHTETVEL
jgi:hypothetical protein